MEFSQSGDLILVRLHQDEDLFEMLRKVGEACEIQTAVVLSGIGMLKQAELNFFVKNGEYSAVLFPEPMELVSMTGNVIHQDGDWHFHIHAVLARHTKEAVAGHLSKGKVNVTNEIVILKTGVKAARRVDAATGLMALSLGGD
jgi:predicted DNA-binding protein with PD1-like motif